jgi:hypothetical protein
MQSFRLSVEDLVQRSLEMNNVPAAKHESGVDDDSCQPGGERRPSLKRSQVRVCPAQASLHSVFGIFPVAEDGESGSIESGHVDCEELVERTGVARETLLDEFAFVARWGGNRSSISRRRMRVA